MYSLIADECMQKDKSNQYRIASKFNNEQECTQNAGEWMEFNNYLEKAPVFKTEPTCVAASKNGVKYIWGRPMHETTKQCIVALPAPECKEAMWSRVNHLGNGKTGQPLSYKWTLPNFPSEKPNRCVLRIRYCHPFDLLLLLPPGALYEEGVNQWLL